MTETDILKINIQTFKDNLQNAFVDKLILCLDSKPTFNKAVIPFSFDYAFYVILVTNRGNFKISSSATFDGTETFWTEKVGNIVEESFFVSINSLIKSIQLDNVKDCKVPARLFLRFDNRDLFIYCAEIYDRLDGSVDYILNDEMILVLYDKTDTPTLDALLNYG